jgi:hypothetical protein
MRRIGLEHNLECGFGGVAPACAQLGVGKLDLQVVRFLGFELERGLIFLDRFRVLLARGGKAGRRALLTS